MQTDKKERKEDEGYGGVAPEFIIIERDMI